MEVETLHHRTVTQDARRTHKIDTNHARSRRALAGLKLTSSLENGYDTLLWQWTLPVRLLLLCRSWREKRHGVMNGARLLQRLHGCHAPNRAGCMAQVHPHVDGCKKSTGMEVWYTQVWGGYHK